MGILSSILLFHRRAAATAAGGPLSGRLWHVFHRRFVEIGSVRGGRGLSGRGGNGIRAGGGRWRRPGSSPSATCRAGRSHSEIRDATKVGGTILAVGSGNGQTPGCADPCPAGDTAILWKWDGVSATITALPNLVVNTSATTFHHGVRDYARRRLHCEPRAQPPAQRAAPGRASGDELDSVPEREPQFCAVSGVNLPGGSPGLSAAVAISNGGSVLYGLVKNLTPCSPIRRRTDTRAD